MVYGIPLLTIILIYLRITIYIHQSSSRRPHTVRQWQKRDFLVIRRILLTILIMMGLETPTIVLFIMSINTEHEHRLAQHVQWFIIALSTVGLHVFALLLTSQTERMIVRRYSRQHSAAINREGTAFWTMSRIPCIPLTVWTCALTEIFYHSLVRYLQRTMLKIIGMHR